MKKVNQFIVESVMNSLIHTNKSTTTSAVKEMLLALGYYATSENVYAEIKEIILQNECISTYKVTKSDEGEEFSFNENSTIIVNYGTAKEYSLNDLVSKNRDRVNLRNEVINYFLDNYEKLLIKEMASGELYINPYGFLNDLDYDETAAKVRMDLKHLPITIYECLMDLHYMEDFTEPPEFMIEFKV